MDSNAAEAILIIPVFIVSIFMSKSPESFFSSFQLPIARTLL
jgi:hypothetical protein